MGATLIDNDVWRMKIALPGHSVGHVNGYALHADDGILLIDTGWAVPESLQTLQESLRQIGSSPADVRTVLLTHIHADHVGSAGWFQREVGAWVGMHENDADQFTLRYALHESLAKATWAWAREANIPKDIRPLALQRIGNAQARVADCRPDRLLSDGQVITHGPFELVVFHTPPHTSGHLCFYERSTRTLFSGDMVLPRINRGPAYRPTSSSDPYREYVESLTRLATLDTAQLLPGHLDPIPGSSGRIEELLAHHRRRLESVLVLVSEGSSTAWQVASRLPRSQAWEALPSRAQLSAVGEAYAYLARLLLEGRVASMGENPRHWRPL